MAIWVPLLAVWGVGCRKPPPIPEATEPQAATAEGLRRFIQVCLKQLNDGKTDRWVALTESWIATEADFDQVFPREISKKLWRAYRVRADKLPAYRRKVENRVRSRRLDRVIVEEIPGPKGQRKRGFNPGERKMQAVVMPGNRLLRVKLLSSKTKKRFLISPWMYANGRWRFLGQVWQDLPKILPEQG